MPDERARIPEQSVMDVLDRALGDVGQTAERVVILVLQGDGYSMTMYSNARSEPELTGMLHMCLNNQTNVLED